MEGRKYHHRAKTNHYPDGGITQWRRFSPQHLQHRQQEGSETKAGWNSILRRKCQISVFDTNRVLIVFDRVFPHVSRPDAEGMSRYVFQSTK